MNVGILAVQVRACSRSFPRSFLMDLNTSESGE